MFPNLAFIVFGALLVNYQLNLKLGETSMNMDLIWSLYHEALLTCTYIDCVFSSPEPKAHR